MLAKGLVAAQFGLLAAWIASGWIVADGTVARAVQLAGLVLALWAFAWMILAQRRMFRISPDPTGHRVLVTDGPYRWVRHPMYLSILLVVGPPALTADRPWPVVVFVALVIVLIAKLTLEERMLAARFSGYADYRKATRRLIPFVF